MRSLRRRRSCQGAPGARRPDHGVARAHARRRAATTSSTRGASTSGAGRSTRRSAELGGERPEALARDATARASRRPTSRRRCGRRPRRGRTPGRSRSRARRAARARCGRRTIPSATTSRPSGQRTSATVRKRAVRCSGGTPFERSSSSVTLSAYVASSPAIAGRVHAGRAAERVDLEAGVVGDRGQACRVAIATALSRALPSSVSASSTTSGTSADAAAARRRAAEDRGDLRGLVRVGGGAGRPSSATRARSGGRLGDISAAARRSR